MYVGGVGWGAGVGAGGLVTAACAGHFRAELRRVHDQGRPEARRFALTSILIINIASQQMPTMCQSSQKRGRGVKRKHDQRRFDPMCSVSFF